MGEFLKNLTELCENAPEVDEKGVSALFVLLYFFHSSCDSLITMFSFKPHTTHKYTTYNTQHTIHTQYTITIHTTQYTIHTKLRCLSIATWLRAIFFVFVFAVSNTPHHSIGKNRTNGVCIDWWTLNQNAKRIDLLNS